MRVAALMLSAVGIALAASAQVRAETGPIYGVAASSETPSAALARHMRTLATSPKTFEALIGAGRAALELGDTQAAVGFFGRADEVFSRSPLPQAGMGAAAVVDGDAAGALIYFARAVQLGATPTMIGADRGLAYDLLGRHAEAQADYKAALHGRDGEEARRRLALSQAISGDKNAALATLSPLLSRGDAAAGRCRALVLAVAGDTDNARRILDARMPGSGAQMAPFFRRLPALRSHEKAAAVHLGIFPGAGQHSYALAAAPPAAPAPKPEPYSTTGPGERVASVEQWLRQPSQAAPAPIRRAPVQMASASVPHQATMFAARPAPAAVQAPARASGREKVWLQLASGQNPAALPDQFRRLKARNRDLLDGISGYVAEEPSKARLLIGPFKSKSDAEIFAEDLESVRIDAFSWTSPPHVPVRKLSE